MARPQKRQRTSYLQPNSEFLFTDFTQKRISPIGLLKNGHRPQLKPVRLSDNKYVTLSNTCAFDAVTQLLCCAFCDSASFNKIVSACDDIFCKLINQLARSSVSLKCYRMRAEILSQLFSAKEMPTGLWHIDCYVHAARITNEAWGRIHSSGQRTLICQNKICGKVLNEGLPFISFNCSSVAAFEENVSSAISEVTLERKCRQRVNGRLCGNMLSQAINVDGTCFCLEPANPTSLKLEITTELRNFPSQLKLSDRVYHLRGVLGFEEQGVGHFIAYCRRHDGLWEVYNDLNDKKIACLQNKTVTAILLLYTT